MKDEETKIIKQKNIIKKNEFEEQVNKLREEVNEYNKNKEIFKEEIKAKKIKYTKIFSKQYLIWCLKKLSKI